MADPMTPDVLVALVPRDQVPDPRRHTTADDRLRAEDMHPVRATEYLRGRAVLRWSLAHAFGTERAGAPITLDDSGKPRLTGTPEIGISVAHSAEVFAAALAAGREVGVDVQNEVAPTEGMIRRCCRAQDRAGVAQLPADLRKRTFTAIWAVQEACLKADGAGVRSMPGRVAVVPFQWAGRWRDLHWRLLPPFAGEQVAVATSGTPTPPRSVRVLSGDAPRDLPFSST